MPANTNHKSTELIILMSDKIDFQTRNIIDRGILHNALRNI